MCKHERLCDLTPCANITPISQLRKIYKYICHHNLTLAMDPKSDSQSDSSDDEVCLSCALRVSFLCLCQCQCVWPVAFLCPSCACASALWPSCGLPVPTSTLELLMQCLPTLCVWPMLAFTHCVGCESKPRIVCAGCVFLPPLSAY
jgi:hypothetical protein